MSNYDVFYSGVNHCTAREGVQGRRDGSGRSEAGGGSGYRSVLHFHLLRADLWSQRLKGESGAPGASHAPSRRKRRPAGRAAGYEPPAVGACSALTSSSMAAAPP